MRGGFLLTSEVMDLRWAGYDLKKRESPPGRLTSGHLQQPQTSIDGLVEVLGQGDPHILLWLWDDPRLGGLAYQHQEPLVSPHPSDWNGCLLKKEKQHMRKLNISLQTIILT